MIMVVVVVVVVSLTVEVGEFNKIEKKKKTLYEGCQGRMWLNVVCESEGFIALPSLSSATHTLKPFFFMSLHKIIQ